MTRGPAFLGLRSFYFLYYAGVGAFLGYFAAYLRGRGFTGAQIGSVTLAQQLVSAPAALLWAQAADRLRSPTRALRLCVLGALGGAAALPFASTPHQVGAALVLLGSCGSAVVPLVDSATVEATRRAPGSSYARVRLFGSLGFVLSAQLVGLLLALRGDRPGDPAALFAYLACVAGWALLAQGLATIEGSGEKPHAHDALRLLRDPRLVFVLALSFVHWAACAPYHLLFGVLVRDRGFSAATTGAGMALGVLAEVVALLFFPALLRRFGLRALFASAFAGSALRFWFVSRAESAHALVLLQLFHALSFGVWWGCVVEALTRVVPARVRATGQALFSALVFGAGNAVGYALAGWGYDRFGGAAPAWAAAAAAEVLALALLWVPLTPDESRV